MKLYNYWRSSCSWRVRIALAHKKLPYEYVPVNLVQGGGEQHHAAYRTLNPLGQVPTLVVDAGGKPHAIAQSLAIIEYLEELHPEPPLLPKNALKRAKVRELAEGINAGIQPLHNLAVQQYVESQYKADKAVFVTHWLTQGLTALEATAAPVAGRCMVGDDVTLADVCLVPQLYGARRFDLNLKPYPTLLRIEHYLGTLPAFQSAAADKQIDSPSQA